MLDRLRQAWRSAVMGAGLLPVCWVKTAPVERRRTLCGGSELSLLGQNHPFGGSDHVLWRVGTLSAGSEPPLWTVGTRFVEGRSPLCWVGTGPLAGRNTFCGGSEPSLLGRNRPCGGSEHVLWRVGTSPHLAYILLRGRWCGVDYASWRKGFMCLINIL